MTRDEAVITDFSPHVLREYAVLADGERGALIGPFVRSSSVTTARRWPSRRSGRSCPRSTSGSPRSTTSLGSRGIPLQSASCGAKHAVQGFNEALRCELLHEGSHVRDDDPVNLWEPADAEHDGCAHGAFDAKATPTSRQLWFSQHHGPSAAAATGIAALTGGLLARRASR